MGHKRKTWVTFVTVLTGCVPELENSDSQVNKARILAIAADPAESAPREKVRLRALYASPEGTVREANLDWSLCSQRKPLSDLGPIAPGCLALEGDGLGALPGGLTSEGSIPADACRLFGPDRPPPVDGEPIGRPADPDSSGGYYQPLRLYDPDNEQYAIFDLRVFCGLTGVTQQQFARWNQQYRRNRAPELSALELRDGDALTAHNDDDPDDHAALEVAPGQQLALRVRWSECSDGSSCDDGICGFEETRASCAQDCTAAVGCSGREHYLYYDRQQNDFQVRRESMRVAWYANGGQFKDPRTGADADDDYSDNDWTAPNEPADLTLWLVLRDDRGGVGYRSYLVHVTDDAR